VLVFLHSGSACQIVEGLGKENFHAKYRGKSVEILKLETDMSQRIVVLLDASAKTLKLYPLVLKIYLKGPLCSA
jgi:hypothetical protein